MRLSALLCTWANGGSSPPSDTDVMHTHAGHSRGGTVEAEPASSVDLSRHGPLPRQMPGGESAEATTTSAPPC